ncbi:benenodin family lasso peptide [Phytopseudomonas dryadis]|uniref:Benenodin family lasso peptide n=1 Tax=Phytopseudomonas dryadis TaxID=2487520 RepID=A0A4Q9QUA7_9GAMM|nr:benenodin family lasso peptide [Pseudomonas dryadis]TBU86941.1 hypothetical protein DNK44_21745 [Pseudomonas dryadis]
MDLTIQQASNTEAHNDDIIVLGAASVETKGGGTESGEMYGRASAPEIDE